MGICASQKPQTVPKGKSVPHIVARQHVRDSSPMGIAKVLEITPQGGDLDQTAKLRVVEVPIHPKLSHGRMMGNHQYVPACPPQFAKQVSWSVSPGILGIARLCTAEQVPLIG
jgi:hypothetical protein